MAGRKQNELNRPQAKENAGQACGSNVQSVTGIMRDGLEQGAALFQSDGGGYLIGRDQVKKIQAASEALQFTNH